MNPSPDRGKECLPPKKRESRQGSAEQHVPLDNFKPPAPLRSRSSAGRGEAGREAGDSDRTNPNPHLLPSPPTLPAPGVPLTLPWHLAYSPPVPLPLFPGQVGERRGSGSPSWREDSLSSALPHHSRWLRGDGPLTLPPSTSSSSSFKTPFPADSREMWYFNTGRRDYSSSIFSPPPLFSQPPLYPPDPSLAEVRHRYLGKRPNGLDGPSSRTASTSRPLPSGEYGNDSGRARLDFSPHGSHTNGGRRQQEDLAARIHSGGVFFPDSQTQEGPETHSSLQDRDPRGTAKAISGLLPTSPQRLGPDPRAGRGGLLDPLGAQSAEAQIYYSLGSVYPHHSPQAQAYPLYSPSGSPLYGLQREPGPRTHGLRNSPHSPLGLPNSHDRTQRERDRERDKDRERDREREREQERDRERNKDGDKDRERDKDREHDRDRDRERDSERERRRDRERDRESSHGQCTRARTSPPATAQPPPPTLLPHFAKGSLIELASGRLKRVEELRTEDFLRSADTSPEFHLGTCTVLLIAPGNAPGFNHLQVLLTDRNTQELLTVLVEYPFFVRDRGWSSCSPQRTTQLYGLPCRQLAEGDVCLALTPTHAPGHRTHTRTGSRAHRTQLPARAGGECSSSHREEMPPPPPPPPLPHHPPPPVLAPPPAPAAADPPAPEGPRPRKRRWSAPDILPPARTDKTPPDLPHGSKQMKWQ